MKDEIVFKISLAFVFFFLSATTFFLQYCLQGYADVSLAWIVVLIGSLICFIAGILNVIGLIRIIINNKRNKLTP